MVSDSTKEILDQLTSVFQKRQVLALRVTARDCRNFRTRRISRCSLAVELLSNVAISQPDVHFTTSLKPEEAVELIGPFLHRVPRCNGVDINASDVRDGAARARDQLETFWGAILEEEILQEADKGGGNEHDGQDGPFVV